MHMPGGTQLLIIALIVLILFGGKKIPELAKGLGSGIKNFKNALNEDENKVAETKPTTPTTIKADEKI
jgi:sec-independent protein translocase protein TatA